MEEKKKENVVLARALRRIRENCGMPKQTLATRMGYTSGAAISKIEKGDMDIPVSKLRKAAEALNTSPAVLLGDITQDEWEYIKARRILMEIDRRNGLGGGNGAL